MKGAKDGPRRRVLIMVVIVFDANASLFSNHFLQPDTSSLHELRCYGHRKVCQLAQLTAAILKLGFCNAIQTTMVAKLLLKLLLMWWGDGQSEDRASHILAYGGATPNHPMFLPEA